jgi:hypothetical protein
LPLSNSAVNIKEYIESGILETYVLGAASESEASELLRYKELYPEVENALNDLETDMELMAETMAIKPPPDMWNRISDNIDGLITTEPKALRLSPEPEPAYNFAPPKPEKEGYIEIDSTNTHIRIHKSWRWVFAAVFLLGKIFLGTAIYYYLENRQAQEQIQELKAQVKQAQAR